MGKPRSIWQIEEVDDTLVSGLADSLAISDLSARILCNRGLSTREKVEEFLACDLGALSDPFLLKGMQAAVERIIQAVKSREKIVVYGDYDVDGVTSTALLLDILEILEADCGFYIPDRQDEGYGLNPEALRKLAAQGYQLVITVDCGISALAEADYAAELGLELIITDHHEPPEQLPRAVAVINPKQPGCAYPFKDLAGVGVACKLAQALFAAVPQLSRDWTELLDLVTLGTIADMVPLLGENRTLVKHGLARIRSTQRVGIRTLLEIAGLEDKEIGPGQVGFGLAPRINATGRIGDAAIAVQLLRTEDVLRAREMAEYLDSENQARQEIEATILAEALAMLQDFNPDRDKSIVLASQNWHPGVIGIVASRLVERFYRPVFLIALDGTEGKGSGRSISGFNLHQALGECGQLLLRYGGHKQAAGLAIKAEAVEQFRDKFNYLASLAEPEIFVPKLRVDGAVALTDITAELVTEIKSLGPFGIGNPSPVLLTEQLSLQEARGVGKEKNHLKIRVKGHGKGMDGIGFNLAGCLSELDLKQPIDVAFTPDFNEYNGRVSVQLQLKDLHNSAQLLIPQDVLLQDLAPAELSTIAQLIQGKNVDLAVCADYWFPVKAAAYLAKHTGGTSLVVYPLKSVCQWAAVNCDKLTAFKEVQRIAVVQQKAVSATMDDAAIVFTTPEFLHQVLVKLKERQIGLGLLVDDGCLAKGIAAAFEPAIPVLRTETARNIIAAQAPARERLARLYTALRHLAKASGLVGSEPQHMLAEYLGETKDFVTTGLEIFEELNIVKRENEETGRIFYFRAPKEKLDLSNSRRFAQGLVMADELAQINTNS